MVADIFSGPGGLSNRWSGNGRVLTKLVIGFEYSAAVQRTDGRQGRALLGTYST